MRPVAAGRGTDEHSRCCRSHSWPRHDLGSCSTSRFYRGRDGRRAGVRSDRRRVRPWHYGGLPGGIGITFLATLVGQAAGLVDSEMLDTAHPLTSFISRPDAFSFIVSLLAGIAGIYFFHRGQVQRVGRPDYARGGVGTGEPSTAADLAGMILAGTLTLVVQRRRRLRAVWRVGGSGYSGCMRPPRCCARNRSTAA